MDDVNNYRGITLISNLAKVFTSVLNNRLMEWSSENDIISDAQFGFKPGFGTTDAIFALHGLISNYLSKGKKLYCCFVDYKKAFDKVNRNKLFFKLNKSGIKGKLLNVIRQLYSEVKSCVKFKTELSDFFLSTNGVMQGEALSPFLFSLYINDFEGELLSSVCEPTYLRELALFLLMYADDTVLMAESKEGLQDILDKLHTYCAKWDIEVNVAKTKIVVFRNGMKLPRSYSWSYNMETIEIVNSFNYLGLTLNFNGNFALTQKILAQQGTKCMFGILKTCKDNCLNIQSKLRVFDTYVACVLSYGAEIWGFHVGRDIEKVHTRFCKMILKVKNSTSNFMTYTELGRVPLVIHRKVRILKYWVKILSTHNCILKQLYDEMYDNPHHNSWISDVKDLLCSLGFSNVWYLQKVYNPCHLFAMVKQRLTDIFIQERNAFFEKSSKCYIYRYLTDSFDLQYYLRKNIPEHLIHYLSKYRLSAHKLAIEQGRYRQTERSSRVCKFCNFNKVEDEYHFILECPQYGNLRDLYIKKYYYLRPSTFKLIQLLSIRNRKQLNYLCVFLKKATNHRNTVLA